LLNRTLHKERTIVQWLSFDEPQSRLKKAIKRDAFSSDESVQANQADYLAALAFAVADVSRFKPLSFKRAAQAISGNKLFERFQFTQSLSKIHPQLAEFLRLKHGWAEEEIIWTALCIDLLAKALAEFQDAEQQTYSAEFDAISFLTNVRNRIESNLQTETVTECGALVKLATVTLSEHREEMRSQLAPDFLPEKLLIVEGQTEAILIPLFARLSDFDLSEQRILLLSGGGANQVAKRFLTYREATKLPIASLLDGDAESQYEIIGQHMQLSDLLFSLPSGEFEDTFEIGKFVQLLNRYLQSMTGVNAPSLVEFQPLKKDLFSISQKRTQVLNKIWREKSLGNFDKVEFADFVAQTIKSKDEIPKDLSAMLERMKEKWGENR
jgi:hypothetical protein